MTHPAASTPPPPPPPSSTSPAASPPESATAAAVKASPGADSTSDHPAKPHPPRHLEAGTVTPALSIRGLTHRYSKADRDALSAVDLAVQPGEAFALLGPNGGGKTTIFRILATLLAPSRRDAAVAVFGHDVQADPAAARRELGVVFQSPSLDIKLTARENLAVQSRMYGLSRREAQPRIDAGLAMFHLTDRQHEPVENFSGGMRRKLEIAKALLHRPRLLLMDEPATGLDPAARRELWDHLLTLRQAAAAPDPNGEGVGQGLTIVWTTHLMDEAERADRLAILAAGRVLTVDRPAALKAAQGRHVVTVQPHDPTPSTLESLRDRLASALGPWPADQGPVVVDQEVRFDHVAGPSVVVQIAEMLPGQLRRVSVGEPTLEDAYLRVTAAPPPASPPPETLAHAALSETSWRTRRPR